MGTGTASFRKRELREFAVAAAAETCQRAAAYPGYDRTWRASIELAADIETLSQDLQKKFDHQAARKVVQIIIEIVRMIHINISGVPALPPGSTIS